MRTWLYQNLLEIYLITNLIVGSGTDPEELNRMAGGDGKAYVVSSFDELIGGDFVGVMTKEACKFGEGEGLIFVLRTGLVEG